MLQCPSLKQPNSLLKQTTQSFFVCVVSSGAVVSEPHRLLHWSVGLRRPPLVSTPPAPECALELLLGPLQSDPILAEA